MVQIPSAGMSQIYITSCMQLSVPDSCISSIKVHMIERLREKQLEHELKRLTRSERTHRLCTRAGMLETFLREPTLLTDDDVMELLTFLFHGEAAQKKLDTLIEERRKTLTTDGSENPLF